MKRTVPLRNNRDFQKVYKNGKFYAGRYIVVYSLYNRLSDNINRIGITASKKVGKSVRRNKIKRLIKENYRLMEAMIKTGHDIVFVIRNSEKLPDFYDIRREMFFLLKKLLLLKEETCNCLKN
ncbi:MAG: ribonuclease P protein component [Clostridiaceae bacterium]|nr:ribonuclease P protein component [Clostridiaceae bacterium]